jgi:hypothetical protein
MRSWKLARRYDLLVVEDAAQGVMSAYKGKALGAIGHMGCFSFHETKNYSMGEGGALIFRDETYVERAEVVREKGTDRSRFLRGQVDKYTWTDIGSSFLPSELNAAYLLAQLEHADEIYDNRMRSWDQYHKAFADLATRGRIERPTVPQHCRHNAHMYYIKARDLGERTALIAYLTDQNGPNIGAVFHYIPLHSAPAGEKIRTVRRRGRIHDQRERAARPAADVLRPHRSAGRSRGECRLRFLCKTLIPPRIKLIGSALEKTSLQSYNPSKPAACTLVLTRFIQQGRQTVQPFEADAACKIPQRRLPSRNTSFSMA